VSFAQITCYVLATSRGRYRSWRRFSGRGHQDRVVMLFL